MGLTEGTCEPCNGNMPPLEHDAIVAFHKELDGWNVVNEHHLIKQWGFSDFASALAFTNEVGALAEREGHHPDILLAWGKVELKIWTHAIDGLTESDFILAAKCDQLT
jgi:4a-hydroxytetrahydrobiopterin dehydratase